MGEVYTARDSHLDQIVAIKTLPTQHSGSQQATERFTREASDRRHKQGRKIPRTTSLRPGSWAACSNSGATHSRASTPLWR
jgi:serine/threonine protein kinase